MRTLKLLGKRHKVKWYKTPRKDRNGDYDSEKLLIRMFKAEPDQQKEVLLHEIMHAIEHALDIDLDPTDPENHPNLTKMSQGIFAVMRENPGLAHFIFGDESDAKR